MSRKPEYKQHTCPTTTTAYIKVQITHSSETSLREAFATHDSISFHLKTSPPTPSPSSKQVIMSPPKKTQQKKPGTQGSILFQTNQPNSYFLINAASASDHLRYHQQKKDGMYMPRMNAQLQSISVLNLKICLAFIFLSLWM